MTDETTKPRSKTEDIKLASRYLRGTIAQGLGEAVTGALADNDTQLTKFHGTYQQDDRDLRAERARKKMERAYIFMIRLRLPGGVMTPAQWLAMDRICEDYGNHTLRLTTRQTIQLHGIIKSNLKRTMQAINACLLDTRAACGDVNRNATCATNPYLSEAHAEVYDLARRLSAYMLPRTEAYHEIWLDGEKVVDSRADAGGAKDRAAGAEPGSGAEEEPIYGRFYMPRKFKIGIAVPPRNDIDVLANDLGFIAIIEDGRIAGYDIAAGGGMGMTHGEPGTYPRIGDVFGFCLPDEVQDVARAVLMVQREYGDRLMRNHARLKYTIDDRGMDWFKAEVEAQLGRPLAPARPFEFDHQGDRYGWVEDHEGNWHYTLFVQDGRVKDEPGHHTMRAGLRAIAAIHDGEFRLTPNENLIIARIPPDKKAAVQALLDQHGLDRELSGLRANAMSCVALPTCGLALAESERYLPDLLTVLEEGLERVGLRDDEITLRLTGCPNGCARPYLAEIGLVGRGPGLYNLYLGGAFNGTRLNKLYRKDLDHDAIVATLNSLFEAYARGRLPGEHFSDFTIRTGIIKPTVSGMLFHADVPPEAA